MKKLAVVLLVVLTNLVTWGLSHPVRAEKPKCSPSTAYEDLNTITGGAGGALHAAARYRLKACGR